jgi:hypothetical protein
MRKLIIALMLSAAPVAAHAECIALNNAGPAGFINIRRGPSPTAPVLWSTTNFWSTDGHQSAVKWCGRHAFDERGTMWAWVSFTMQHEPWEHKGWVSAKVLSVPSQEKSFEEGVE